MSDDGPGAREVAHRVFAAEFDDASLSYSESDEERAPNYVVMPTGARVNRLFVAGVLTEIERVNDETRRGRVVDPSGAFVTYAGQYQPEAQAFLERAESPEFVALTGKARTFEPEDGDRVFTSVRPESLNEVDADTRDRWVVSAAEATLDRLAVFEKALGSELRGEELRTALEAGGASGSLAAGIPKAIDHYDTSTAYVEAVRQLAVDALKLIAGDRDEVRAPDFAPSGGGEVQIGTLPETDVTIVPQADAVTEDSTDELASVGDEAVAEAEPTSATSVEAETTAEPDDATAAVDAADTETVSADTGDAASASASAENSNTGSESATPDADTDSEPDIAAADAGSDELGDFDTESDDAPGDEDDLDAEESSTGAEESSTGVEESSTGAEESSTGVEESSTEPAANEATTEPASDEMYELDDAEREEIESEFGTDFSTGTEVDDPGEADIDVPDPEEMAETGEAAEAAEAAENVTDESADGTQTTDGQAAAEQAADETETDAEDSDDSADVDLEAAAIDAMESLDEGDGADREAVVEAVVDEHGVDADAVEDAIQDALMSGKCYEPGDGMLKPI